MILLRLEDETDNDAEWLGLKPENNIEAAQLDKLFRLHERGVLKATVRPNPDDGSIAIALRPPGPKIEVTP